MICAHGTGVGCLACAGDLVTLRAELATLRAERDRMRPVVEAAVEWFEEGDLPALAQSLSNYLASEPTKETK